MEHGFAQGSTPLQHPVCVVYSDVERTVKQYH